MGPPGRMTCAERAADAKAAAWYFTKIIEYQACTCAYIEMDLLLA